MKLLHELTAIRSTSGDESAIKDYILTHIENDKKHWVVQPQIFQGRGFQDAIVLIFGTPRTAVFAHTDSIGFTVGYDNELIKIGGPRIIDGTVLVGSDSQGEIETELMVIENEEGEVQLKCVMDRTIDRGTNLTFKPNFRDTDDFVQSPYLDNRLGVWMALQLAKTLQHGAIVFSTYEEHGGGSVGFLADFLWNRFNINQALIADITWVTKGVKHGEGVAISMRDQGIPRRSFLNHIIDLTKLARIPYQLEVESAGGSDGSQLQKSPYPFDWCFIGAAEDFVHTPDEKVHKMDIASMLDIYQLLMREL